MAAVTRLNAAWYGFAVSDAPMRPDCAYWALATTRAGCRAELAGLCAITDWEAEARRLFGLEDAQATVLEDRARGTARVALQERGQLRAALFVAPEPVAVMRDYLATTPGAPAPQVLTGRTPADVPDPGPTLCACFGVGVNTIVNAIEAQGLMDAEAVGAALGAGTNCGACKPEIAALVEQAQVREAAE